MDYGLWVVGVACGCGCGLWVLCMLLLVTLKPWTYLILLLVIFCPNILVYLLLQMLILGVVCGMTHVLEFQVTLLSHRMGLRSEDIISKHGLQVHNDGTPTCQSGKVATAPDVSVT